MYGRTKRDAQGDIACSGGHRGSSHNEADDAEREWDGNVPEPLARTVRVPACDECDDGAEHPRRRAEQKGDRGVVAHSGAECREERVERKGDDHAGESDTKPPNLPIQEGELETVEASATLGLLAVADADVFFHALLGEADFLGTQPIVRGAGEVWEDKDGEDRNKHSEGTLDEEQPSTFNSR